MDAKIAELTELVQAQRFVQILPKKGTRNARKAARKKGMKNMGKKIYLTMKFHLKRGRDELIKSNSEKAKVKAKLLGTPGLGSPREEEDENSDGREVIEPESIETERNVILARQVFMVEDKAKVEACTNKPEMRRVDPWVPSIVSRQTTIL